MLKEKTSGLLGPNVNFTWSFDHCIRPMHLGAFLQANLAPKVSSVSVS